jgi:2-desacetyl-2-hydroxyethyl bacteriochlorophyllide A dehydrogenase
MIAGVIAGPGVIEARDIDLGDPDGKPVVEITRAGICGTDLKIADGSIPVTYPRVLGHEMAGVVESAGRAGQLVPGSRVLIDPAYYCGRCAQCRAGHTNLCRYGGLLGRDADGGIAERIAVDASQLHLLPDGVTDDEAPLIQVLATCVHAQSLIPDPSGQPAVVVGLGVTGLMHVQLLKSRGCSPVIGVTRSEAKRARAREFGADLAVAPADAETSLADALGGEGPPLVVDCAGTEDSVRLALEVAAPAATVLCYGTISAETLRLPFYQLYFKQLRLQNARASVPEDFGPAIAMVSAGKVRLDPLISGVFALRDVAGAIRAARDPGQLKVLISCR